MFWAGLLMVGLPFSIGVGVAVVLLRRRSVERRRPESGSGA